MTGFLNSKKILFVTLLLFGCGAFAQHEDELHLTRSGAGHVVHAAVLEGDTVPWIWLPSVTVEAEMKFATRRQYVRWTRIRHNVKKVYPYAIMAAAKLKEYDLILERMPDEKMRKTYLKMCERELQKQFGAELKNLSVQQGRILMKLIDRETGKTTYTIVQEMRGNFQAFMWQSLAVLFGNNMKKEYDANGEDRLIEVAIQQVESGQF